MLEKQSTISVVGKKGQLTIPVKYRELLGIADGVPVRVTLEGDYLKIELLKGGK